MGGCECNKLMGIPIVNIAHQTSDNVIIQNVSLCVVCISSDELLLLILKAFDLLLVRACTTTESLWLITDLHIIGNLWLLVSFNSSKFAMILQKSCTQKEKNWKREEELGDSRMCMAKFLKQCFMSNNLCNYSQPFSFPMLCVCFLGSPF